MRALVLYLCSVALGVFLIARFFRARLILNLLAGVSAIVVPAVVVVLKLYNTALALSPGARGGLMAILAALFAMLAYTTSFTLVALAGQTKKENRPKPTFVDLSAYALGIVLLVAFTAANL